VSKLFIIGLVNNGYDDFENLIQDYVNWSDENGKETFETLTDFDLDFLSLDNFWGDLKNNVVNCFEDIDGLKTNLYEGCLPQVYVICDIFSFDNSDVIVDKLRREFNYFEYKLSNNPGEDVFNLEEFIKNNCTV
jgi:hypothetical protein